MSDPGVSRRRWQPDWRLLVFAGLLLPLLIGLGVWQLDRAGQKQRLLDQWQQDVLDLDWPELVARGLDPGRPVSLDGMYGEQSWLLDNRTRDGRPGYEVLTVFYPLRGPAVVVNRGWVPAPRTRDRLPEFTTPETVIRIDGRLGHYPEPPVLTDSPAVGGSWPRRVQSLPRALVSAEVPEVPAMLVKLADSTEPGAFRADWAPDLMGPQTHYGYAAQWFALALALTILTVVASYRKTGADNDNDNG